MSDDLPKVFQPESGNLTPERALLTIMLTNYGKKKNQTSVYSHQQHLRVPVSLGCVVFEFI